MPVPLATTLRVPAFGLSNASGIPTTLVARSLPMSPVGAVSVEVVLVRPFVVWADDTTRFRDPPE